MNAPDSTPPARPFLVKVALLGVPTRAAAWLYCGLSLAAAGACVVAGFWDVRFFAGLALVLAALWYYLAIRWVDRHGHWQ